MPRCPSQSNFHVSFGVQGVKRRLHIPVHLQGPSLFKSTSGLTCVDGDQDALGSKCCKRWDPCFPFGATHLLYECLVLLHKVFVLQ
jgi:hypothetical protein